MPLFLPQEFFGHPQMLTTLPSCLLPPWLLQNMECRNSLLLGASWTSGTKTQEGLLPQASLDLKNMSSPSR